MRTYRLVPFSDMLRFALLVLLAVAATACGGDSPTQSHTPNPPTEEPPVPVAATVEVAPGAYILPIGTHRLFNAVARAADGTPLEKYTFEWSSSDVSIATVDASGNVVAHRAGQVTITARMDGVQGQARVDVPVPPPSVATVEVQNGPVTLRPGQTHKLWAVMRSADGTVLNGKDVTWSSSSGAVVVDNTGRVYAVGMGSAVITATSEGRTGAALVTVEVEGRIMTTYQLASIDGVSLGQRFARLKLTEWTSPDGVVHPAEEAIVGGVLVVTMQHDGNPKYEMEMVIATFLLDTPAGEERQSVTERIRTDRGTVLYDWATGNYIFQSSTYAGLVIPSTRTANGLDSRQNVGGGRPDWTFGWVREP